MQDFLQKMLTVLEKGDRVNYRDRRGHYASGNLTCLRDQYWSWLGEPETNTSDAKGILKMGVGNAVEKFIIDTVLRRMSYVGYHFRGTQIAVGQSNPNWDGYLDGLMDRQIDANTWETFVVEIKTKSGYGADLFSQCPEPSLEYMTQIGLYLKNMSDRGITSRGKFLFILLSDKTFGELVTIDVTYNPENQTAYTTSWQNSNGKSGSNYIQVDIKAALERWKKLDEFIAKHECPPGEYQYKYPLSSKALRDMTDAKLKKLIEGALVWGDWQPLYSRYKNKALAADGLTPERTEGELQVARSEYKRRHPKSKI